MTTLPGGATSRSQLTRAVLWALCGLTLVAQLALPWTTQGPLSASSSADALRLVRSGTTASLVPPTAGYLLLVLPMAGVALIALSWPSGRRYAVARLVASVVAAATSAAYLLVLVGDRLDRLAPAGWATLIAAAIALVVAATDTRRQLTTSTKETHP